MINFPQRTEQEFAHIEQEMNKDRLLEAGNGQAEVTGAAFAPNKNGIPMLTVHYKVWDKSGKIGYLKDWLMYDESSEYKYFQEKKIREFCVCFGLNPASGTLSSDLDLRGACCEVAIGIRKNAVRNNAEENFVAKYIKANEKKASFGSAIEKSDEFNDDLPF